MARVSNAEMSGWLNLRPVRMGLVFEPTAESLTAAVQHAAASWGGVYFPFLDPANERQALAFAEGLGVDALYAVDQSASSEGLARTVGFIWKGGGQWGPFGSNAGYFSNHVQSVDWLFDEDPSYNRYSLPTWPQDHPLASVFAVMYGLYGADETGQAAQAAFGARAYAHAINTNIEQFGVWPYDPLYCTPIDLTAREIEYAGEDYGPGIVVLQPDDVCRLCLLWNLRASGHHVCPWIIGHETVSNASLGGWLDHAIEKSLLPYPVRGDGVKLGPHISVHLPAGTPVPDGITAELDSRDITGWEDRGRLQARSWRGHHPFHTDFSKIFRVEMSRRRIFEVPTPPLGNARWRRAHRPGLVIADISVSSVSDLAPDLTMVLPEVRSLDSLVDMHYATDQRIHRVVGGGRAIAVRADSETVELAPVASMAVMESLMSGPGWSYRQTDNGRFSTRLIERLGGSDSYVANQPAVRAVLAKTAASHAGQAFGALISFARQYSGEWKNPSMSLGRVKDYPTRVVRYLLSRKALQPVLPVRCPSCTAEVGVRPEDLRSEYTCELCGEQVPLGLALGMRVRNDWSYRLPGDVDPQRLSETLPVMAALSVLGANHGLHANSPYLLGLEVDSPGGKFEIDLAMIVGESYPPLLVVGEVKGYRDSITPDDLSHLAFIQKHLRSNGIDCYILVATLRDDIPEETVAAIRAICADAPDALGTRILPIFPIVLTGKNLSVPSMHEDNPLTWHQAGTGQSNLAVESCRRSVGLLNVEYRHVDGRMKWVPTWRD